MTERSHIKVLKFCKRTALWAIHWARLGGREREGPPIWLVAAAHWGIFYLTQRHIVTITPPHYNDFALDGGHQSTLQQNGCDVSTTHSDTIGKLTLTISSSQVFCVHQKELHKIHFWTSSWSRIELVHSASYSALFCFLLSSAECNKVLSAVNTTQSLLLVRSAKCNRVQRTQSLAPLAPNWGKIIRDRVATTNYPATRSWIVNDLININH